MMMMILACRHTEENTALVSKQSEERDTLQQRHRKELEELCRARNLELPPMPLSLLTPSPPIHPLMDFPATFASAQATSAASESYTGSPASARRRLGLPMDGGSTNSLGMSDKPRKPFSLAEMMKYAELSTAPAPVKVEVKKTLNELRQEKDMKNWDGYVEASATGAGGAGGAQSTAAGAKPAHSEHELEESETNSCSASRKSSTDLSASQSSIPELLRQQQLQYNGGSLGLPSGSQSVYGQYGQTMPVTQQQQLLQQQHLMQQMNHQWQSMMTASQFPFYFNHVGGTYNTFGSGNAAHPPSFPLLNSNTFVVPGQQGSHHAPQVPMTGAAVGGVTPVSTVPSSLPGAASGTSTVVASSVASTVVAGGQAQGVSTQPGANG
jgi:hypothetical protein